MNHGVSTAAAIAALAACAARGCLPCAAPVVTTNAVLDDEQLQSRPEPEPETEPEPECVVAHKLSDGADGAEELASAITIMVNTSPIELHPSTIVIEEVVGALLGQVPLLRKCPILVVCDWFKVKDQNKYRSGQITAEKAARYQEYVRRLRCLSARDSGNVLEGAQILVLSERCGFGFAVKAALPHVSTPYILMQQHDRRLRQPFDVLGVLRAMEASKESHAGPMHYVGLCTTTTLGHAGKMRSKHQIDIEPHCRVYPAAVDSSLQSVRDERCSKPGSLRFVPLLQWYDSTHLCCTKHYRTFVFGRRNGKRLVAKGGFIEDKLSQQQQAEVRIASEAPDVLYRGQLLVAHFVTWGLCLQIREGGIEANRDWGTYLLDDGSGPHRNWLVEHLDGHDVLTIRKCKWAAARSASEQVEVDNAVAVKL
eukprot:COSAG02_NODE_1204_length_13898_cov_42.005870_10_plen_424_part_00